MTCPSDSKAMVKGILLAALAAALVTGCDSKEVLVPTGTAQTPSAEVTPTGVLSRGAEGRGAVETRHTAQGSDGRPTGRPETGPSGRRSGSATTTAKPKVSAAPRTSEKKTPKVESTSEEKKAPQKVPTGPDGKETPVPCPTVYDEESRPVYKC